MTAPTPPPLDLAVVGLGAAGGSLAWRLAGTGVRFAVVEPPPSSARRTQLRTWCTWGASGPGPFGHLVAASWSQLRLVAADGSEVRRSLDPWRYRMLHSTDVEAAVRARLADAGVPVLTGVVEELTASGSGVAVRGEGVDLAARRVLDTRPVPVPRTGRTLLLQHFLGRRIRTRRPVFDAATVTLMDFRVPQPRGGVAFGYVLPTSPHEALVEYTEFSRDLLTDEGYDHAWRDYLQRSGVGEHEVLGEERGVIPMTDAEFPPHPVAGVVRFGAAAGAVRPSTGYAFSAVQRQSDAVAAALAAGREPVPPQVHGRRHLLMDSLVLEAVARSRLAGDELFVRLFRRNPVHRVLGFLDGTTGLADDLRLMASSPRGPMLRTVAGRYRRRSG
ncbi:lycopene cyclase [Kineococcus sp. R8]|uniref:lycopene cyclase family protein n=1 Tax=Kineococcus siccus TaxID=2696567 RepID=UPI001412C4AD|nr:lycopene cyclase [Kineococcus siccus]